MDGWVWCGVVWMGKQSVVKDQGKRGPCALGSTPSPAECPGDSDLDEEAEGRTQGCCIHARLRGWGIRGPAWNHVGLTSCCGSRFLLSVVGAPVRGATLRPLRVS